ncbi:MAG: CHAD domain-containing protein [Chloroflexi bacterium]|nr:CHAD domain-containing protein [Chloroflexota bacterium]
MGTKTVEVNHAQTLAVLREHARPVLPEDTMAEAGRQVLLAELIVMLEHEAGSRTGDDIEDVHDMRVAIRRMRSAFNLLTAYYKPKTIRPFVEMLRRLARALGAVRDLDVLIENLHAFGQTLETPEQQQAIKRLAKRLEKRRKAARARLIRVLDRDDYRAFVGAFTVFLTTPGMGARGISDDDIYPSRVRHLLPTMIYSHLGMVRAYDTVIAEADVPTLHALRIEFKRLRYVVSMFGSVLGSSLKQFVAELKTIQDYLGTMNDGHIAREQLRALLADASAPEAEVLRLYIARLETEERELHAGFLPIWEKFNQKTVQRYLASAVASI